MSAASLVAIALLLLVRFTLGVEAALTAAAALLVLPALLLVLVQLAPIVSDLGDVYVDAVRGSL